MHPRISGALQYGDRRKEWVIVINVFESLSWLNAIDGCSYLNDETRRLINFASKFTPHDSKVVRILERLRNAAHSWGSPLEKAEILLNCAAIGYWRGCFVEAACDAEEALLSYDDDDHRRAAAFWMLGMTRWKMFQNHDAYANWFGAKEIFKKRKILFQNFPQEKAWYRNWIRRMNVELVKCPEEIWTWLNWFERPYLRPPTQQIVDHVQEKVRHRVYSNVYALMQDLQEANRRSEEVYERAEIYLEFGLAIYQMGNTHFAIDLLRKSVRSFSPGIGTYHKQTVARCLLGTVEWLNELSRKQADADWVRSIEEFENLRSWASKDNEETKRDWYTEHRASLYEALLEQRRNDQKPSNPYQTVSEENEPNLYPSTAQGQKIYSYEDLLIKVRRDRVIADRLIEFERKKAPTFGRNELIKRAIERWMRDNQ